jgi:glycosyltransferase involved in cell wall biosynthesis
MKVIHIALGKANPNRMNGVNRIVHNLASYQRRAGCDVEVWGITRTPDEPTFEREYPLRLFLARSAHRAVDPALRGAINALDARAVVHFHGGLIPEFFKIARALRRLGCPYILTPHGAYNAQALRKRSTVKRIYLALVERALIEGASAVHCSGRSECESLARLFPDVPLFLVPNGVSLSEVDFQPRPVEVRSRPLFGYCGRIDNLHKGLDLLIDGFLRFKRSSGEGELWIIGNGPDLPELQRRVEEAGEADSVVFFGERHGDDKLSLLAQVDAFLHPSRFEGFPMSVLEAAALGKCLVVSDRTNTEEYVERYDAGVVLRQGTSEEIAKTFQSLQGLYASGECTRRGANSLRMIEEELNWKAVSAQLVANYRAFTLAT